MRKVIIASVVVLTLFGIKSCGKPYGAARDTVEDFMEEIKGKEGMEAIRYLHPSYRDSLAKELKLPIQFTELRPSEILACLLSTMGSNIEDVDITDGKIIGEKTALIKVKVEDKRGIEKIFNFVLIKEDGKWLIADISPYVPPTKVGEK